MRQEVSENELNYDIAMLGQMVPDASVSGLVDAVALAEAATMMLRNTPGAALGRSKGEKVAAHPKARGAHRTADKLVLGWERIVTFLRDCRRRLPHTSRQLHGPAPLLQLTGAAGLSTLCDNCQRRKCRWPGFSMLPSGWTLDLYTARRNSGTGTAAAGNASGLLLATSVALTLPSNPNPLHLALCEVGTQNTLPEHRTSSADKP
ncbi:hypothetical protein HaLaN_03851 [Haematococcus lacustris]|uniref:Uncharacterized protein n=1 Tax=Haematococcus lacustris TaxID=44745 RepID=A0A699YF92_HAELA|nr:hypothetical protein HaLaN_03851 [Haematococcus lacustris]